MADRDLERLVDQLAQDMEPNQTVVEFPVYDVTVLAAKPGIRAYLGRLADGRPVIIKMVDHG